MKEQHIDLFTAAKNGEAICITTNGIVKRNGQAVMGAGIAKTAKERFTGIDIRLGQRLTLQGNHVYCLGTSNINENEKFYIFSFPTKHNWRDDSDLQLIKQSCKELVALCNRKHITTCYLPKPGCKNGHLDWENQVKPVIEPLLDDRFIITSID